MKHRYIPMTDTDREEMLSAIGIATVDELFEDIPEKVRFKGELNIKKAKSESALTKELAQLAAKNADARTYASFLGAGVTTITSRSSLIMSFHVLNFIQHIHRTSLKFRKVNCKRSLNSKQ